MNGGTHTDTLRTLVESLHPDLGRVPRSGVQPARWSRHLDRLPHHGTRPFGVGQDEGHQRGIANSPVAWIGQTNFPLTIEGVRWTFGPLCLRSIVRAI